MPVSIVRNLYLLSEAFELVGRRLFGTEWNGTEYGMRSCPSPEDMWRARAPHVEALQRIESELAEIDGRIKHTLKEAEIRELVERRRVAFERRSEVNQQLFSFPEPTDTIAWAYASHQRKLKAEATLISAIKEGKIPVQNGRGSVIDSLLWRGHPNFHYCIELSVVRVPSSFSSIKVQPAQPAGKTKQRKHTSARHRPTSLASLSGRSSSFGANSPRHLGSNLGVDGGLKNPLTKRPSDEGIKLAIKEIRQKNPRI